MKDIFTAENYMARYEYRYVLLATSPWYERNYIIWMMEIDAEPNTNWLSLNLVIQT